ncbi:PucR family transcriptional regulator ligand-binding domain-containing protein [Saxibacter everestensis]|uniref:PucR family transcriptional regulator ligand-binding domain-containing protein n=1 Tax=Saxibacter everestensis TaxID=2909229 RepID=A0ABY8QSS8_9MICO|nr:PucR family transcriptional regulator ligand-binding domain-containing protein [Brevibacteriaceae bacterium ZFBP1038]
MPLTVADVLDVPAVRRGKPKVVAGAESLNRQVTWVHVLELPDTGYLLQGGELVLSTGIALPDNAAALRAFIRGIVDAGVAGLVIELGKRYRDELPAALVTEAERSGLPLIALANEIRFVAVTRIVHEQVLGSQVERLKASEEVHRAFHELTVRGATQSEVISEAARLSAAPVVLEDLNHRVLGFAGLTEADADDILGRWQQISRRSQERGWITSAVGARGHIWGRLVMVDSVDQPSQAMLLERAASTLALGRLLDGSTLAPELSTHRNIIAGLMDYSLSAREVSLRAKAFGVGLEGRQMTGIALVARTPETAAGSPDADLLAELDRQQISGLIGRLGRVPVMLLPAKSPERAEQLLSALASALPAWMLCAGECVAEVRSARESLATALHVADVVGASGEAATPWLRAARREEQWIWRVEDLHVRGLLHELRDDVRLQAFAERELAALHLADAAGANLIEVLSVFLGSGGSKVDAAKRLHLSRPALYAKLGRIERLLGVSLDDAETRTSLHLAVLALGG